MLFYKPVYCKCGFLVGDLDRRELLNGPREFHCYSDFPIHSTCGAKFGIAADEKGKKDIESKMAMAARMDDLFSQAIAIETQLKNWSKQ